MGGGVSTDFKSSKRIEISRLVQVLLNFEWFWGSPLGGGAWVDGGGGWWESAPHPCAHAHMYDIIGNSQGFPNGGGHLHEIIMFTTHACACMCMCACTCMCTCVGVPPNYPPPPSKTKSRRKPKTPKFNNSWTNWDNSILFEDFLPLNIPELI